MVVTEFFKEREDGVKLVRTYSDTNHYIIQDGTGFEYIEAIDPEKAGRTYTESEREIEKEEIQ